MTPGTAKILQADVPLNWWIVKYANIGSNLQGAPEAFRTEDEARRFCTSRRLKIINH